MTKVRISQTVVLHPPPPPSLFDFKVCKVKTFFDTLVRTGVHFQEPVSSRRDRAERRHTTKVETSSRYFCIGVAICKGTAAVDGFDKGVRNNWTIIMVIEEDREQGVYPATCEAKAPRLSDAHSIFRPNGHSGR